MSIILRGDGLLGNMTGTAYRGQVTGNQAPVWSRQGKFPGFEEEHRAVVDVVCAKQLMDDAQQSSGRIEVNTTENIKSVQKTTQIAQMGKRSKPTSSWIERDPAS